MPMNRQNYEAWQAEDLQDEILAVGTELKNLYKNEVIHPANTLADRDKSFAPSHLFWEMNDYYQSYGFNFMAPYVSEFLVDDDRAPYRDYYKQINIGIHFPELVKAQDEVKPGDSLVFKKADYASI